MFLYVVMLHSLGYGYADGPKILYVGDDAEVARGIYETPRTDPDNRCVRMVTWFDGKQVGDEKLYL